MRIRLSGPAELQMRLRPELSAAGFQESGEAVPDLLIWAVPRGPLSTLADALATERAATWTAYAQDCTQPAWDNSGEKSARGSVLWLADVQDREALPFLMAALPAEVVRFAPDLRMNLLCGDWAEPGSFFRPALSWLARSPVITGQILGV